MSGGRPLLEAAEQGALDDVVRLVDGGADVGARDGDGSTPLHNACWARCGAVARVLVGRGARGDVRDGRGRTPAMVAAVTGCVEVFVEVPEVWRGVAGCDDGGDTALIHAARHGRREVAALLLRSGQVDVDHRNEEGVSAFVAAVLARHEGVACDLVASGAAIDYW